MFLQMVSLLSLAVTVTSQSTSSNNQSNVTHIDALLKLHGIAMIGAWGIIIPFGLSIAIMCKAVCPGKKFLIAHMSMMLIGMLLAGSAILLVLIYSNFKWLTTQSLNNPHQIAGLIAIAAFVVNPLLAVVRPSEESKWRGLIDFAHGGTGMFLSYLPACAAMLLAVYLLPALAVNSHRVKIIRLLISGLVGYILFLLALYNIYVVRYHKDIPKPSKIPALVRKVWETEDNENNEFPQTRDYDAKIPLQSSPDAVYRVVVMTLALVPMIGLGMAAIIYLAILQ